MHNAACGEVGDDGVSTDTGDEHMSVSDIDDIDFVPFDGDSIDGDILIEIANSSNFASTRDELVQRRAHALFMQEHKV